MNFLLPILSGLLLGIAVLFAVRKYCNKGNRNLKQGNPIRWWWAAWLIAGISVALVVWLSPCASIFCSVTHCDWTGKPEYCCSGRALTFEQMEECCGDTLRELSKNPSGIPLCSETRPEWRLVSWIQILAFLLIAGWFKIRSKVCDS